MPRNREGFILTGDQDGHWYFIPARERENFEEWVEDMEKGRDSDFDFDNCRIDGPHTLLIYEWEEI